MCLINCWRYTSACCCLLWFLWARPHCSLTERRASCQQTWPPALAVVQWGFRTNSSDDALISSSIFKWSGLDDLVITWLQPVWLSGLFFLIPIPDERPELSFKICDVLGSLFLYPSPPPRLISPLLWVTSLFSLLVLCCYFLKFYLVDYIWIILGLIIVVTFTEN